MPASDSKKDLHEDSDMKTREHYSILSDVFRYPGDDFLTVLDAAANVVAEKYPEAEKELRVFISYMKDCDPDKREEIYTKTFDVQPICYLDLGYVIFGEDYKRGAFLLHMQEEQQKAGNDCGPELPDNLSNILTLFSITSDEALVEELASSILIPGLRRMVAEFDQARVELKEKVLRKLHKALIDHELNFGNVYRNALQALLFVVLSDFPEPARQTEKEADPFIANAGQFFRNRKETELETNFKLD